MENRNFIIILGSFQNNTFEIVHSIIETLELPNKIHVSKSEKQLPLIPCMTKMLVLISFDWNNFSEIFSKFEDEIRVKNIQNYLQSNQAMVIMLSPETNLIEQFLKLFNIYECFPINVLKIISIIDHRYFDGHHENLLDAMAYFSDILLIDNDLKINPNRINAFVKFCKEKECYPLPIKIIRRHSVRNISELFDDQTRRMTLIFDDLDPIDFLGEEMVNSAPFSIPTVVQQDKYLKKNDRGQYCFPIEPL